MRTSLGIAVVDWAWNYKVNSLTYINHKCRTLATLTCCFEGPGCYNKALEEYALLKVEPLLQRRCHVGRGDGEWDGNEAFFQDVVHFEIAHDTPLPAKDA